MKTLTLVTCGTWRHGAASRLVHEFDPETCASPQPAHNPTTPCAPCGGGCCKVFGSQAEKPKSSGYSAEHLSDALTWIERNFDQRTPGMPITGIALVARALAETTPVRRQHHSPNPASGLPDGSSGECDLRGSDWP